MANVAHLVRASGCGSEGSGFNPHHSPQIKNPSPLTEIFYLEIVAYSYGLNDRPCGS